MYRDTYLEDRVMSASPVELIRMLYEGAIEAVGQARTCVRGGDITGRARAVTKAAAIVGELAQSLRPASPEIERNLRRLYDYVLDRLREGNVAQREEPFAEAERVLVTLLDAWQAAEAGPGAAGEAGLGSGGQASAAAAGRIALQG